MKIFLGILLSAFILGNANWQTNFNVAKEEATKENKLMLLNFSGSDWCSPCIQLKRTIFESDAFNTYATENLILVNADFPRQNKHKLSAEQKKMNEEIADKYNPEGKFPYTILLSPDGKILKQWDGLPKISADEFVVEIKNTATAGH